MNQPLTKQHLQEARNWEEQCFPEYDVCSAVAGLLNDLFVEAVNAQESENPQYDAGIQFAENVVLKWFPVFAEESERGSK